MSTLIRDKLGQVNKMCWTSEYRFRENRPRNRVKLTAYTAINGSASDQKKEAGLG